MGFGGECGGSRAARADGAVVWVWNRRTEQLARVERDWAAQTTALGTADAAKWVNRQEHCLTQPRATISMNISTGPCGRPAAEAAERRRGALPHWKSQSPEGGTRRASFLGGVATPCMNPAPPTPPARFRGGPPAGTCCHIYAATVARFGRAILGPVHPLCSIRRFQARGASRPIALHTCQMLRPTVPCPYMSAVVARISSVDA